MAEDKVLVINGKSYKVLMPCVTTPISRKKICFFDRKVKKGKTEELVKGVLSEPEKYKSELEEIFSVPNQNVLQEIVEAKPKKDKEG